MDRAEFPWDYAIGSQALRILLGEESELRYGLHFFSVELGGRHKEPFPSGITSSRDPIGTKTDIRCQFPVTCLLVNNYLEPLGSISLLQFAAQYLFLPIPNQVF